MDQRGEEEEHAPEEERPDRGQRGPTHGRADRNLHHAGPRKQKGQHVDSEQSLQDGRSVRRSVGRVGRGTNLLPALLPPEQRGRGQRVRGERTVRSRLRRLRLDPEFGRRRGQQGQPEPVPKQQLRQLHGRPGCTLLRADHLQERVHWEPEWNRDRPWKEKPGRPRLIRRLSWTARCGVVRSPLLSLQLVEERVAPAPPRLEPVPGGLLFRQ